MQPSIPFFGTPSQGQAYRIQQIISRREEELAQIDKDIIRVRALLQQLLQDRSDIRESLEAHKELIAPQRTPAFERIPAELWAQIFLASLDVSWESSGYPRIDIQKPPLLLGQVCKSWRELSFTSPRLWSSICISRHIRASAVPLIEMWLERSGVLPLSIEIHGLSSDFPSIVLDSFIPYSARWHNLALIMSNTTMVNFFAKPGITLSSLRTLMLRLSGRSQHLGIALSAHCLRSVALLTSRGVRPDPHLLDLPWSLLTHLSVTSLEGSIDDGYDILMKCSALTHCSLSAVASTLSAIADRPPIRMKNLCSLHLTTNRNPGCFLDTLILPCLIQLEIDFVDVKLEPTIWPRTQVTSLVTRSSCRVQSLILRNKIILETDLVECCQCIPSLRHLLVTGNGGKRTPMRTLELVRASIPDSEAGV